MIGTTARLGVREPLVSISAPDVNSVSLETGYIHSRLLRGLDSAESDPTVEGECSLDGVK